MLTTGEIVRVDFIGLECHRGAEIGAHGALAVRGDKREAVPIWRRADLEAAAVSAESGEAVAVELPVCAVAGLAEEGSRSTETSESKERVAGRAAGGAGDGSGDALGDLFNCGGFDKNHAALVAFDSFEKGVFHLCDGIDDGTADADNFNGCVHLGNDLLNG